MDSAEKIAYHIRRDENLEFKKDIFKQVFSEVANLVRPERSYFYTKTVRNPVISTLVKTDDTASLLLPSHCAIMNSLITPAAYNWESFVPYDINARAVFSGLFAEQAEILHKKRYSAETGWVGAIFEAYANLATFGFTVMEVRENLKKKKLTYHSHDCTEFTIDINADGVIDTFHRKTQYTYRQLRFLFPEYIPENFTSRDDLNWLEDKMELLQCVEPSLDEPNKWINIYIDRTNNTIIQESVENNPVYFGTCAFKVPLADCPYGYSPIMLVIPSIKALNSLQFNLIKMTDNSARDDILANVDAVNPNNLAGRGLIIEGGIDDNGQQMVQRMNNPDVPTVDYLIKSYQDKIKTALFLNYSQTLNETQSRSATDAVLKANEKANVVSPYGDRIIRDLLIPIIEKEISFYSRFKMLPEFPPEADGLDYEIVIDNPLLKAQRLDSANGIMTMAQYLTQLSNVSQEFNMDRTKQELASILNVNTAIFNTVEEKNAILAQQQQQQELAQLMNSAGGIGSAVKDIAQAEQINNGVSNDTGRSI